MIYKDYDDWFKWNCKGCRNFFGCNDWVNHDKQIIPDQCQKREPEI